MAHTPTCLVCLKELENFDPKGNQPLGGLEFQTHGHYGSTVFDPMDGTKLAINVCDECLTARSRMGIVLKVKPKFEPRKKETFGVWNAPINTRS